MSSVALQGVYDETQTYEDGRQYAGDDKLFVTFSTRAVKNEFKSKEAGRGIFDEVEYIRIIIPGSRDILDTPVDDTYRNRFAERYNKWKAQRDKEQTVSGTLLAEIPWMTKSMVAELNSLNVVTVEQLVDMPDVLAKGIMGFHQLRARAGNFLKAAQGEAPMLKMQAELEARDRQISELQQTVAALQEDMRKALQTKKG